MPRDAEQNLLKTEVQSLLKQYDERKGPFRKAAGYIPLVGAYYSQTATIKQVREMKYSSDNIYWFELFNLLNQYSRPDRPTETTVIIDKIRAALMENTPWQHNNELFILSLKIIQKSNITLTLDLFLRLAVQHFHSATVYKGLGYLANGSKQLQEIESLEIQENLLTETYVYLLCLDPEYADRLAIGIRYLNLANIDTQFYIDLLIKHAEYADILGHGLYLLAKHNELEYCDELCREPSQALNKARQLCVLESPPSVAPTQASTLSNRDAEQTSSTQAAASPAKEQEIQPASAQPSIPEKALRILRNAGLENETNLKDLGQNLTNAKPLANGFCALHQEEILNKKNRRLLLARPELAEITALILGKLNSVKILNDEKRLVIVENYDSLLTLAFCFDFLEQSFAFTKESMDLLFEHIKEIQIVHDVLLLLDENNLLNPLSSALVLELLKTKHIEALRDCLDLLNDTALLNSCEFPHKVFKPEYIEEFRDALTNAYLADGLTDATLKDLMQAAINPAPPASPALARQASNLLAADSKHPLASSSHTLFRTASLQALKGKARPFSVRFTKHLPEKLTGEDITQLRSTSFADMSAQLRPQFR